MLVSDEERIEGDVLAVRQLLCILDSLVSNRGCERYDDDDDVAVAIADDVVIRDRLIACLLLLLPMMVTITGLVKAEGESVSSARRPTAQ